MYHVLYGGILFEYFLNQTFPNISSYESVYGRKPPAMSDLQLQGDSVTRPPFYHFTDYLDLLNERMHAIRYIVKMKHN